MNKLVSVIIPAYNHENYIQDSIRSVINQTYNNIELIVIDDGSKDSTWLKICELKEECEKRFQRTILKTKENEGSSATINKLISLANGEYITILASDDILKPNSIEKLISFLENNKEYALVVGNNELIDYKGNICYWDKNRNPVYDKRQAKYYTFADFLKKECNFAFNSNKFGTYGTFYYQNYIPNGYLIRSDIFAKIEPFTKEAPLEDHFLMLQISKYAKMKYIDEVLFSYRIHQSNTFSQSEKMKQMRIKTKEYEEKILSKIDETKVLSEVIKVKEQGYCYKKRGIPYIFEIKNYIKGNTRYKTVKLFGIKIKEYKK